MKAYNIKVLYLQAVGSLLLLACHVQSYKHIPFEQNEIESSSDDLLSAPSELASDVSSDDLKTAESGVGGYGGGGGAYKAGKKGAFAAGGKFAKGAGAAGYGAKKFGKAGFKAGAAKGAAGFKKGAAAAGGAGKVILNIIEILTD